MVSHFWQHTKNFIMQKIKEILREASVEVDIQGHGKHIALFETDFERVAIELVKKLTIPVVMPRYLIANSTPEIEGKECLTVGNAYKILCEYDGLVCVIDDHNRLEVMVNSFFNGA